MSDHTYVVGLPDSAKRLTDRSLIIIRTNGNRDRIGNAYRPSSEAFGCAVSAFQFSAELESTADRDWLYWWLKAPARQQAMSEAASGTTGLGNLASGWLKQVEVPWPDIDERAPYLETVEGLSVLMDLLAKEINALERVRASAMDALLSNRSSIDADSYDTITAVVA